MEEKNILTVSKGELEASSDYVKEIQEQNRQIAELRKKQIFNALTESTQMRVNINKNIQNWINILADKIFNQSNIDNMKEQDAIKLFKYVFNMNLKVMADSNRLEEILGKYLQSSQMDQAIAESIQSNQSEREKIKSEIMTRLHDMMKMNRDDEIVTEAKVITATKNNTEDLGLIDEATVSIDKNVESTSEKNEDKINQKEFKKHESDIEIDDDLLDLDDDF